MTNGIDRLVDNGAAEIANVSNPPSIFASTALPPVFEHEDDDLA